MKASNTKVAKSWMREGNDGNRVPKICSVPLASCLEVQLKYMSKRASGFFYLEIFYTLVVKVCREMFSLEELLYIDDSEVLQNCQPLVRVFCGLVFSYFLSVPEYIAHLTKMRDRDYMT